jgi:hypothetical protein
MTSCFHARGPLLALTMLLALAACSTAPKPQASSDHVVIAMKPPPADVTEADKKAAGEIVGLFLGPCLGEFPRDAAVESYAKEKGLTPMTEAEIRAVLKQDPGEGWVGKVDSSPYELTLEKPPYHACAIRRRFTARPKAVPSYFFLAVALWSVPSKNTLAEQQPPSLQADGMPTEAHSYLLKGPDGRNLEQFLVLMVTLPDGGYEVHLVRQILAT